ncbi:MAG: hypothetical protein QM695_12670 [Micropruina sp.]
MSRLDDTTITANASRHSPSADTVRIGSSSSIWISEPTTSTMLPRAWIGPRVKTSPIFSESIEQRATRSAVGCSTSFSAGTRRAMSADSSRKLRTSRLPA